jgi:hypothetical protein
MKGNYKLLNRKRSLGRSQKLRKAVIRKARTSKSSQREKLDQISRPLKKAKRRRLRHPLKKRNTPLIIRNRQQKIRKSLPIKKFKLRRFQTHLQLNQS